MNNTIRNIAGANALSPDRMTTRERLDEIAAILALGLVRLSARQSSRIAADRENSFVDFNADQCGGAVEIYATEDA